MKIKKNVAVSIYLFLKKSYIYLLFKFAEKEKNYIKYIT